jgi:hypothetical protein
MLRKQPFWMKGFFVDTPRASRTVPMQNIISCFLDFVAIINLSLKMKQDRYTPY